MSSRPRRTTARLLKTVRVASRRAGKLPASSPNPTTMGVGLDAAHAACDQSSGMAVCPFGPVSSTRLATFRPRSRPATQSKR